MALKTSTKGAAKTDDSQGDPTSQDASQDTGFSVGQMAKTFSDRAKEKTSERRQQRTAAIKIAHDNRIGKQRTAIKECFAIHDTQVRALRRPTVERLATLMHRKRELEARAVKCQVELARSFEEAAQQLQASIDGRVEDTAA